MDYSVFLSEISNNQTLILNELNNINKGVILIVFLLAVLFIYIFCGNITKVK